MGTGLYKLANTNTCVETQYQSVYDIPIMDYNREMKNLEELKGKKILFFTAASQNKRAEHFIQSILSKKSELEELNIELVALTTNTYNHENTTFDEQKSYYNTFGVRTFPAVAANSYFLDRTQWPPSPSAGQILEERLADFQL